MKSVEYTNGQSHVAQDCPHVGAIKVNLWGLVIVTPDQEGLHDVHGQVPHDQEGDRVPSLHQSLVMNRVRASPEAVNNHWSLNQDLNDDQKVAEEELRIKGYEHTGAKTNIGIEEKAWDAEKEKKVVEE